jgi:beta-glucosidase
VIYGSPYVLEHFIPKLPATIPYVFTYGQFAEAQAIALQSLFESFQLHHSAPHPIDQQFTD